MKEKRGFIVKRDGKLYVRISYTDGLGKRRELMRRARDKQHAKQLQRELTKQLDSAGDNQRAELDAAKMTFAKVAATYDATRLIPAQYVGDRKVAGLRSLRTPKAFLQRLVAHFGGAKIRQITYNQVDEYRLKRLSDGLAIGSVNRELALLCSLFNFAKREGFISRSPFEMGAPLISLADETRRSRVLSRDEEEKLLLALSDSRRVHIRGLVVAALDSGARKNELLTLAWRDVDLLSGVIRLRSVNTKTARQRELPISARLRDELQRLESTPGDSEALVFNSRNLQKHFAAALRDAGISNFRWHDMRHTFASRLAHCGLSVPELAALMGHAQYQTTLRYANPTADTITKAANLLNRMHDGDQEAGPDYVN